MASITMKKITVTVATAGVPVQVSTSQIFTTQIEVFGNAQNTGGSYLGGSDVDSGWIPIAANEVKAYTASENAAMASGDYFDLSKIWVDAATAANVLVVQYYAREE